MLRSRSSVLSAVRSAIALCIAFLLLTTAVVRATTQPTVVPEHAIDSGCVEAGATGYYSVRDSSVQQEVYVLDDDGDGLPEYARCGANAFVPLAQGNASCSTLGGITTFTTGDGCAFTFRVYVGSAGADSADCSGLAVPAMMFMGDGDDTATGSDFGDFIHLGAGEDTATAGDGPDYVCTGPGGGSEGLDGTNVALGEDGYDALFGGPPIDELDGGLGPDVVMGVLSDDITVGGEDNDVTIGGPGNDVNCGEEGADFVHDGLSVLGYGDELDGGPGNDDVVSVDGLRDASVDGGSGTDTCYYDAGSSITPCDNRDDASLLCSSIVANCESTEPWTVCGKVLYVGTHDGGTAELTELDVDGNVVDANSPALLTWQDGGTKVADRVIGLAVDPEDCLLWAVLLDGSDQILATIDTSTQPGGDADYDVTKIADIPGDDLVDIAFGARGGLAGLESDAEWVVINKSTAAESSRTSIGRTGVAYHMAYDATDSALFFVMTENEDDSGLMDVDVIEGTQRVMQNEDHIDWVTPVPFTTVNTGSSGLFLVISETVNGSGQYDMFTIRRRNSGGELVGGNAVPSRDIWEGDACIGQCDADLDHPPDAFTVPIWTASITN